MRIVVEGETEILVQMAGGTELEIESREPGLHFSPLHMLAASLATCTLSVLLSWAMQAGHDFEGLEIGLAWEYVDDPYRVGKYEMELRWPSLPPDRRDAALRAARYCTVESTLTIPPEIGITFGG